MTVFGYLYDGQDCSILTDATEPYFYGQPFTDELIARLMRADHAACVGKRGHG